MTRLAGLAFWLVLWPGIASAQSWIYSAAAEKAIEALLVPPGSCCAASTFASLTVSNLTASQLVVTDASKGLASTLAPPALTTLTATTLTGTTTIIPVAGTLRLYSTVGNLNTMLTVSPAQVVTLGQTTTAGVTVSGALAGAGAGNVNNGTHVYCFTYVTASGETECSPPSGVVTVTDKTADGQVTVTFTTSAFSGVTGRNIYRSKAGTATPLFRVAASPVVNNNSATTYTDNIADASLTSTQSPAVNTTNDARLTVDNTGAVATTGSVTVGTRTGTAASFACFDANGVLVSKGSACL